MFEYCHKLTWCWTFLLFILALQKCLGQRHHAISVYYCAAWNAECRRCLAMRKLSVRLSVRQTRELWQNGRKMCPDFYTIQKTIYPSFLRNRMFGGATPPIWNFGSTDLRWSEIADFQPIFARSSSTVTPSGKVQLTLIGSPLRALQ